MVLERSPHNPILTRAHIPPYPPRVTDPSSVFNPGAIKVGDTYHMLLRVQARSRETHLWPARGTDGVRFAPAPRPVTIEGLDDVGEHVYHVYDPRLTRIDDEILMTFAADVDGACRVGVARTSDLERYELVGFDRTADMRNSVLFPRRIDGKYARLVRPNRTALDDGPTSGEEIELHVSDDLQAWTSRGCVLAGRPHYWDERIGSGPPPLATRAGWLHVYHGVATHFQSACIYQAGAVLLDLDDPTRVLARTWDNVLEPRELYELAGQVPNVVFPGGMVAEDVDEDGFATPTSELKIYYGAADTCIGLATTTVERLLAACVPAPSA